MQVGHLSVDEDALEALCETWGIAELAAFGSVFRDDFGSESDVDLLVTWRPGRRPERLFDLFALRDEFEALFGRSIDLLEREVVESDENPYRRSSIIASAQKFYAAA